jgi:transcriptional regulator with PAS, ATPase and Fis domain
MATTNQACECLGGDRIHLAAEPEEGPQIIGRSACMLQILETVRRVAPTAATVLIEGETGTGKELIARMIHNYSPRAKQPFLPVDCGSFSSELIGSELFGALKGAYTGADRDRTGMFEAADRGTVLLDEIGDIGLGFQLKLLRFLQDREIRPLGAARARRVDVRVLAATNRDLRQMVDEGKFREDVWFRLNVVRIVVPPLSQRPGDIGLLANFFLERYNQRYGLEAHIAPSGLRALNAYAWPGNVRQLEHTMEHLSILAPNGCIDGHAVDSSLANTMPNRLHGDTLEDAGAAHIRCVMSATAGNKTRAARILGIERKTLSRKLGRMEL